MLRLCYSFFVHLPSEVYKTRSSARIFVTFLPFHIRLAHHLNLLGLCQLLNSGNSLLQKLLLERRLGDLRVDGGLNGLNEGSLFGFSLLLFVSDPAVEDGLEFGLDGVFLGELEVGVLKGGGFLSDVNETSGTSGRERDS